MWSNAGSPRMTEPSATAAPSPITLFPATRQEHLRQKPSSSSALLNFGRARPERESSVMLPPSAPFRASSSCGAFYGGGSGLSREERDQQLSTTAVALRGIGNASKTLASVRAALEAAEAGDRTPRSATACSLVRLPKPESHTPTMEALRRPPSAMTAEALKQKGLLQAPPNNSSSSASALHNHHGLTTAAAVTAPPTTMASALAALGPLHTHRLQQAPWVSLYRVAVDSDEEALENDALHARLVVAQRSGGHGRGGGRRGSLHRLAHRSGVSPSRQGSRPGSAKSLRSLIGTPSGGLLGSPHQQHQQHQHQRSKLFQRSLGEDDGFYSPDSASPTSPSRGDFDSWRTDGGNAFGRRRGDVISADEADAIVAELTASGDGTILRETQERLLARRRLDRERLAREEHIEALERDAMACSPSEFRAAVERDVAAHSRAVELKRRAVAMKRCVANHAELVLRNRLAELTEMARQKSLADEGARERRAALLAAGKLRTALGQLDGEETGVRCRIAADERKAFSLIAATMKTRGGAVGRSSSVATGGGAAPR